MIETAWVNDTDGWIELPAGATKNREAHRLVITGDVRAIIESHRRDGARWLFGVERGGKVAPLDPRAVNNEFRNSLKQLGIYREGKAAREHPSPHRMRASAYTWMIEQGIDQRVVDRAFNHKPTGLRRTYGWSAELWEEVKKAVDAWQFRLAYVMVGRSLRGRR